MERATRQRAAIQAAIVHADRPLLPHEVLAAAARDVPGLGIATVYRALKQLAAAGAIVAVELPGAATRYERADHGHHHHFHCRVCGKVFEVAGCPGRFERIAPPGFAVEDHEIVLYGRCAGCAAG